MGKEIIVNSISTGRDVNLSVVSSEKLNKGGFRGKNAVEADVISKNGRRRVWLIEREFSQAVVENWERFTEVGLPVVGTLMESSEGTLLMTDLRADGSEVYGKSLRNRLERAQKESSPMELQELDDGFLNLMSGIGRERIEKEAKACAKIAADNEILLAFDDPFELVVSPDNNWRLICLDLEEANIRSRQSKAETLEANQDYVNRFMNDLRELNAILSKRNS